MTTIELLVGLALLAVLAGTAMGVICLLCAGGRRDIPKDEV